MMMNLDTLDVLFSLLLGFLMMTVIRFRETGTCVTLKIPGGDADGAKEKRK